MIVDTFLEKDKEFLQSLEIFCVAECCGIAAFDFSNHHLKQTIKYYSSEPVIKNLEELLVFLRKKKSKKISIFL